jgi:plastocyanin
MFDHMGSMMGGGRNTANAPLTAGSSTETVTIKDFAFSPGNLQVPVGATVTWTNGDSAPHNATARDGIWKTDTLSDGDTNTLTFSRAGEYDYYCTIHPSMKAHLSVR